MAQKRQACDTSRYYKDVVYGDQWIISHQYFKRMEKILSIVGGS